MSRNAVLYVKGGYSNGRLTLKYSDSIDPTNDFSESDNLDGFHLGAGGEVSFGGRAYGKLEYVYTEYKGYHYLDAGVDYGLSLKRHQVLTGLGVRF